MTINDSNWKFLHDETGLSLTYNDMYYRYLKSLGYTGTLQDMIAAYKRAGGNPFPLITSILGAGGKAYMHLSFKDMDRMFQDEAGTIPAVVSQPVGLWIDRSKQSSSFYASQPTALNRPTLRSNGIQFSAAGTPLRSNYVPPSGAYSAFGLATFPGTVGSTQGIIGSLPSAAAYNVLGIASDGTLRVGIGNSIANYGAIDMRNIREFIGVSVDGAGNGFAFVRDQAFSFTYGNDIDRALVLSIGAFTQGSGVTNSTAATIEQALAANVHVTPSQALQIRTELLAV